MARELAEEPDGASKRAAAGFEPRVPYCKRGSMWGQMSYGDPTGLPPMLIQAGSAETLLDNATRFATAGGAADAFVTLVLNRDGVRGPLGDMVVFGHQSASELGSTQAALRPIHQ